MFVSITKIKSRHNAGWILQEQDWDLERAVSWFYEYKHEEQYKGGLLTEDEFDGHEYGKYTTCKYIEILCSNFKIVIA